MDDLTDKSYLVKHIKFSHIGNHSILWRVFEYRTATETREAEWYTSLYALDYFIVSEKLDENLRNLVDSVRATGYNISNISGLAIFNYKKTLDRFPEAKILLRPDQKPDEKPYHAGLLLKQSEENLRDFAKFINGPDCTVRIGDLNSLGK